MNTRRQVPTALPTTLIWSVGLTCLSTLLGAVQKSFPPSHPPFSPAGVGGPQRSPWGYRDMKEGCRKISTLLENKQG